MTREPREITLRAMRNLKLHWEVLKQETSRSKALGWGWILVSVASGAGFITIWFYVSSWLTYVFHETRSARAITALTFAVVGLLWLARCWRTYHTRITNEIAAEWPSRVGHIRRLSAYEFQGHKLKEKASNPAFRINKDFLAEVNEWRMGADSAMHQISEAHRDAFYKNSECLQHTPDENQFSRWMPERIASLTRARSELQSLPEPLQSYSRGDQIA